jgi:hypothetical protein
MANLLRPNPLIGVDTNVPLDLAEEKEHAMDALAVLRRRLKPGRVLVLKSFDVEMPIIATPREIVAKFD